MTRDVSVLMLAIAVAAGVLRADAALPSQPEPGKVARMRVPAQVPDQGPVPLSAAAPGDVLVCVGTTLDGYQVVALDEAGDKRVALLPYRTEWGHVAARSAAHDTRLAPGTVIVAERSELRPGACPLALGADYPLVASNVTALTVRFQAGGLTRDLVIPRSYADVRPAAPPVLESLEARTELALQASNERQRELRESLREAELRRTKLVALLSQLRMGEVETARLTAALAREGAVYRLVGQWKPQHAGAGSSLKAELAAALVDQAALVALLQCAPFEAEPLRELHSRLAETAGQTQALRADAAGKRTEIDALAAGRRSAEAVADRERIAKLMESAQKERSDLTGMLTQVELDKLGVDALVEQLKTVKAENARINDRLADLTARLGELRDTLAGPDPFAPVTPTTTPPVAPPAHP